MTLRRTLFAACGALTLVATGCLSDLEPINRPPVDPPPAGSPDAGVEEPATPDAGTPEPQVDDAEALFNANIRPMLLASCGANGTGCHVSQDPAFVTTDPLLAYGQIMNYRDRLFPGYLSQGSKLLTKSNGTHYGVLFSATQVSDVQGWLATEKIAAEQDPGSDLPTPMQEWSGCMDLAEFQQTGMADLWADKNANGQGNCDACHNLGAEMFIASNDDVRVFTAISTDIELMPSYFTVDATGTTIVINRSRLEAVGLRMAPHQEHGDFNVDGNAMEALQEFYDLTMARKAAGLCGPPRL